MPHEPRPGDPRYWVLLNNVPHGPFDLSQIRGKLKSEEINDQTPSCLVGDSTWLPLSTIAGLSRPLQVDAGIQTTPPLPVREPQGNLPLPSPRAIPVLPPVSETIPIHEHPVVPPPPVRATHSSVPTSSPPQPMHPYVVTALVVLSGWLLYAWFRPLTPREVCDRFNEAQTLKKASKYMTLNLHPTFEALERLGSEQENSPYEYTKEGDAPSGVTGYLVAILMQFYDQEVKRKLQMESVVHLVDNDGWKIEDIYICSIDHETGPRALSLARDYYLLINPPESGFDPESLPPPTVAAQQIKSWFDSGKSQKKAPWLSGLVPTLTSRISQGICIVLIVVCLGITHFSKQRQGTIRHPSQHMRTGF